MTNPSCKNAPTFANKLEGLRAKAGSAALRDQREAVLAAAGMAESALQSLGYYAPRKQTLLSAFIRYAVQNGMSVAAAWNVHAAIDYRNNIVHPKKRRGAPESPEAALWACETLASVAADSTAARFEPAFQIAKSKKQVDIANELMQRLRRDREEYDSVFVSRARDAIEGLLTTEVFERGLWHDDDLPVQVRSIRACWEIGRRLECSMAFVSMLCEALDTHQTILEKAKYSSKKSCRICAEEYCTAFALCDPVAFPSARRNQMRDQGEGGQVIESVPTQTESVPDEPSVPNETTLPPAALPAAQSWPESLIRSTELAPQSAQSVPSTCPWCEQPFVVDTTTFNTSDVDACPHCARIVILIKAPDNGRVTDVQVARLRIAGGDTTGRGRAQERPRQTPPPIVTAVMSGTAGTGSPSPTPLVAPTHTEPVAPRQPATHAQTSDASAKVAQRPSCAVQRRSSPADSGDVIVAGRAVLWHPAEAMYALLLCSVGFVLMFVGKRAVGQGSAKAERASERRMRVLLTAGVHPLHVVGYARSLIASAWLGLGLGALFEQRLLVLVAGLLVVASLILLRLHIRTCAAGVLEAMKDEQAPICLGERWLYACLRRVGLRTAPASSGAKPAEDHDVIRLLLSSPTPFLAVFGGTAIMVARPTLYHVALLGCSAYALVFTWMLLRAGEASGAVGQWARSLPFAMTVLAAVVWWMFCLPTRRLFFAVGSLWDVVSGARYPLTAEGSVALPLLAALLLYAAASFEVGVRRAAVRSHGRILLWLSALLLIGLNECVGWIPAKEVFSV